MKGLKKLLTGILTVAMVMMMSMTAFAADNSATNDIGTITIDNAKVGQTYNIYRIFDFTPSSVSSTNGIYTINSAWSGFSADTYFTKDSNGYITSYLNDGNIAAFAQIASDYAKTNNITSVATQTATATTVAFDKLPLGYYLSDSSLGAICSLNTTTPTATIHEKNDVPSIDKSVQEDSTNTYGATNDAQIGQTVTYQSTISVKKGAEDYVMHDKMSTGLTFTDVTSVVADNTTTLTKGTDYTINTSPLDGDSFDLVFSKDYLAKVRASGKDLSVVVTYTAILNGNAVIASTGNTNIAKLTYNNGVNTEEHSTTTYTYTINLYKYASGDKNKTLAGAHFNLYLNDGYSYVASKSTAANVDANKGALVKLVKINDSTYRLATDKDTATTTDIITVDGTKGIEINGLDADTYHMIETQAPTGYNLLTSDITVQLSSIKNSENNLTGGVSVTSTILSESTVGEQIKVENKTGALLPATGGIGTTIFYLIGGIMILGAFVTFIVKRKMTANK